MPQLVQGKDSGAPGSGTIPGVRALGSHLKKSWLRTQALEDWETRQEASQKFCSPFNPYLSGFLPCRSGLYTTHTHTASQRLRWHAIVQRVPQLGISAEVVACAWKASQGRQSPAQDSWSNLQNTESLATRAPVFHVCINTVKYEGIVM